jgi:hypothetical protein
LARRARPIHAAAGDLIPIPWGRGLAGAVQYLSERRSKPLGTVPEAALGGHQGTTCQVRRGRRHRWLRPCGRSRRWWSWSCWRRPSWSAARRRTVGVLHQGGHGLATDVQGHPSQVPRFSSHVSPQGAATTWRETRPAAGECAHSPQLVCKRPITAIGLQRHDRSSGAVSAKNQR